MNQVMANMNFCLILTSNYMSRRFFCQGVGKGILAEIHHGADFAIRRRQKPLVPALHSIAADGEVEVASATTAE